MIPILDKHNDGSCFKLTIEYTDFEEAEPFEKHIRWCEDWDELLKYGLEKRRYFEDVNSYAILDFRIQDDSK